MQRRFTTLDVFTAERFAGNPLAVVHDSDCREPERMQAIAREFGLPETVFIHPAADPAHSARLRIFTPAAELPFAGHPTIGTAGLLALKNKHTVPARLILEEKIGPVECNVVATGEAQAQARFKVPALPRKIPWSADNSVVGAALNLAPDEMHMPPFKPEKWSAGVEICLIPVRGLAGLGRARADVSRWNDAFGASGPRIVYLFAPQERTDSLPATTFRTRMFAPLLGIPEDPATGSAAAAFAGLLASHGSYPAGFHQVAIQQGYEMGRPSAIHLEMEISDAVLTSASIAGDAVIVTEGTLNA